MKEIDIDSWERRAHFNHFYHMDHPIYNICFDIDVTKAREYTRRENLSFYYTLIYLSVSSANMIDNFRYRVRDGKVILHDTLHPAFADLAEDSELFKMVTVKMEKDLASFVKKARETSETQIEYFPMDNQTVQDDLISFSMIPWIRFTSLVYMANLDRSDAIPRITCGKYYRSDNRILLPFNFQVNHLFIDGIHLARFKEILESKIDDLF
jgi:chloramphenicol O-acetyltransferase type A